MAEPNPATPDPAPVAPAPGRRGLLRKLLPVVIVLTVVAAEWLIAYSYIPSPAQTEAMAHGVVHGTPPPPKPAVEEKHEKHEAKHGEEKGKEGKPDLIEVELGTFTVTSVQAGSSNTLRIAFRMYGTVAGLDKERFDVRMKETQHRFREQVILAIRAAEMSDLTEPGLGLLKRTILEKTNSALGEPLLKAIVVSDFSFMEV